MKLNHIVEAIIYSPNPNMGASNKDIEKTIVFLTQDIILTNTSLKRIIKKLNNEMKKREAESIPPKTKNKTKCINHKPYNGTEWE